MFRISVKKELLPPDHPGIISNHLHKEVKVGDVLNVSAFYFFFNQIYYFYLYPLKIAQNFKGWNRVRPTYLHQKLFQNPFQKTDWKWMFLFKWLEPFKRDIHFQPVFRLPINVRWIVEFLSRGCKISRHNMQCQFFMGTTICDFLTSWVL